MLVLVVPLHLIRRRSWRTERRDLDLTQAQFKLALDTASVGISIKDAQGNRVLRNRAYAAMLGYTEDEFASLPREKQVLPEHRNRVGDRLKQMVAGKVPSVAGRRRLQHRDGRTIETESQMASLQFEGEPAGMAIAIRDVTAELAAVQGQRVSDEQFRAVFEDSLTPLALIDAKTGRITRNSAFAAMLGYSVDDIAGVPLDELMPGSDLRDGFRRTNSLLAGGDADPEPFLWHYRHRDGRQLDVQAQESVLEVEGERIGILYSARDITDEIASAQSLGQSEERFRAVFEDSVTPMMLWDSRPEHGSLRNRAFAEMLGYSADEIDDVAREAILMPSDMADATRRVQDLTATPGAGPSSFTRRYRHRDGHPIDVVVRESPLTLEGGHTGTLIGLRDVTTELAAQAALQESEERYRTLFETSQVGNVIVDRDHSVRFANAAAERLLGVEGGKLVGKPYSELMSEDERSSVDSALDAIFAGARKTGSGGRLRHLLRPDGTLVPVLSSASNYIETGEVTGVKVELSDTTETLRLRDELLQSQKLEAVGTLVAGVAHDFNNLLTGIGGSIEMAQTTEDTEVWLDRAQLSAARATQLVQQLLSFSRHSDGKRSLVDLAKVTEEAVGLLQQAVDRRVHVESEIQELLGPVWGVPSEIHQVLLNLLVNGRDAVQERPDGQSDSSSYDPRVTVEVAQIDDSDIVESRLRVRVTDNGPGIPPEVVDRVFDPFFTTKEVDRGTGLGLASVYGIARDHGGTVTVESVVGEGTTFTVELPVASISAAVSAAVAEDESDDSSGSRVLIVDDEEVVGTVMSSLLTRAGYEVVRVTNGTEALELAAEQRPDLVLLDVNMPAPNGWEVLSSLLNRDKTIRVLMVSGYVIAEEALERGALGMVQKPFDSEALLAAVAEHIHSDTAATRAKIAT